MGIVGANENTLFERLARLAEEPGERRIAADARAVVP